jgi:uncharacterized protein (DUF302 family)
MGNTMRNKGLDFTEQLRVFEVCNPKYAFAVLGMDMQMNMALPCRISVWTENGQTKLGMVGAVVMLVLNWGS